MKRVLLVLITLALSVTFVVADTIHLRDGRVIRGTLLGFINGRFAVRVESPRTPGVPTGTEQGEIMLLRPAEIDRIEIDGRSLDDLRFETRNVEVTLASNWIDTGVDLRRNERVQVNASGLILAGRSRITPDGLRSADNTAPLPRAPEGMLIGAIGDEFDSPILQLGSTREFVADRDGRLYLTANRGAFNDTRGAFSVQIRRERDLAQLVDDDSPFSRRTQSGRARPRGRQGVETARDRGRRDVNLDIAGTSRGTDTSVDLREGDQVTITASGNVIAGRRIGQVGPEGGRATGFGAIIGTRPVPNTGPGALIGYIRMADGQPTQPFVVGKQLTFTATAAGRLILLINDDDYSDNGGSFKVTISFQ